ncbi:helix-turn-helix domain-containing protein [Pseudomonas lactis]|uniref:helix-turn-helix domain-containing protein n=1 Tax=Pseudomonas TaxID=286 RepID=UPI000BB5BB31|nr:MULTISPECIES: AraC family transcriptional regulator [Pseudomonas]MBA5959153.1 helix-turn-helix domain-containing protein [Pseudomonas lactis]MBA6043035.1 helix-turn-helix domain-containing protein [Pseudomonas lactis]MBJ2215301.1 helix-turn-helix domain-containing protein [Pseudomonas carnis]MBJ2223758.1 helix-turn-helix domain-containing protein [Pseudomonas sp. MF7451]MBK3471418.1 helix-turn-helix domain-containing protein [Pseudomonas carnis]
MSPTLTLRHYLEAPIAHSHDHAQLVFGLSGHLDLEVDGRGSQVRESSVMVLPFSAHHACISRDGSRCLVLDVPTEHWVVQSLGEHADASRRLLDQPARLALDARQHQLVQWLAQSPVHDPLIVQQGAVLLLASLNHPQAQPLPGRRLPYAAFNSHIERHAARPLQVADLARIADLSVPRLHARFMAECGQTPMDYLRSRRLHLALRLLRETSLPIGEIAERVGYASQSAFCAAMLRAFGASPGALRRAG